MSVLQVFPDTKYKGDWNGNMWLYWKDWAYEGMHSFTMQGERRIYKSEREEK